MTGKAKTTRALLRDLAAQAEKNARRAASADQARKHRMLAQYLQRCTNG